MAGLHRDVANIVRCVVGQRALGKRNAIKNHQAKCRTSGKL